jgi:hypothetical protein
MDTCRHSSSNRQRRESHKKESARRESQKKKKDQRRESQRKEDPSEPHAREVMKHGFFDAW